MQKYVPSYFSVEMLKSGSHNQFSINEGNISVKKTKTACSENVPQSYRIGTKSRLGVPELGVGSTDVQTGITRETSSFFFFPFEYLFIFLRMNISDIGDYAVSQISYLCTYSKQIYSLKVFAI